MKSIISKVLPVATIAAILSLSGLSAQITTNTTYIGSNFPFVGALTDANAWDNGLPSNANPGLVAQTANSWLDISWEDFVVRQTGGTLFAAGSGDFDMRGGAFASGNKTILEIEDLANTTFSFRNFEVNNRLTMWAQNGQGHELRLLSGYVQIGELFAISDANLSSIDLRDGLMEISSIRAARVTVNLLAGGTGQLHIQDQAPTDLDYDTLGLDRMRLDFATGFEGSLTIASNTANEGDSASGYWTSFVQNGWASIDGFQVFDPSLFNISNSGTSTTISMIPEPSATPFILGLGCLGLILQRRCHK